jgi:hypothetical protein
MNHHLHRSAAAAVAVFVLLTIASDQGTRAPAPEHTGPREEIPAIQAAAGVIMRWPGASRALAGKLIEKYGVPDETVSSQLSWRRRGRWARIVVFRDPDAQGRHDHLLESVAYGTVPFDRWQPLSSFERGATYDPAAQELAARTNGEGTNILALNLADEIIRGRRTSEEARAFYDSIVNLSLSGKSSPYMSGLLFPPRPWSLPKVKGEDIP